jgi:Ca2+-binding RTX toxin-like protein
MTRMQLLEPRTLFAVAAPFVQDGVLYVSGGNGADVISIGSADGIIAVRRGDVRRSFEAALVQVISVRLGSGDDVLDSWATTPTIVSAGAGNDTVSTGDGNDTIYGQDGDDALNARHGNVLMDLGHGRNSGAAAFGSGLIRAADAGNANSYNIIRAERGTWTITLDAAGNSVDTSRSNVDVTTGNGRDTVRVRYATTAVVRTNSGSDRIRVAAVSSTIFPGVGNDVVGTSLGNDRIYSDRQIGSNDVDNDRYGTEGGDDIIEDAHGNNIIYAGDGADLVSTGGGDDFIECGDGNDTVRSSSGRDIISGGAGRDRLFGYDGDDHISGGPGDDRISGGHGSDVLLGEGGNDLLMSAYSNTPFGVGIDLLDGGAGEDIGMYEDDDQALLIEKRVTEL